MLLNRVVKLDVCLGNLEIIGEARGCGRIAVPEEVLDIVVKNLELVSCRVLGYSNLGEILVSDICADIVLVGNEAVVARLVVVDDNTVLNNRVDVYTCRGEVEEPVGTALVAEDNLSVIVGVLDCFAG